MYTFSLIVTSSFKCFMNLYFSTIITSLLNKCTPFLTTYSLSLFPSLFNISRLIMYKKIFISHLRHCFPYLPLVPSPSKHFCSIFIFFSWHYSSCSFLLVSYSLSCYHISLPLQGSSHIIPGPYLFLMLYLRSLLMITCQLVSIYYQETKHMSYLHNFFSCMYVFFLYYLLSLQLPPLSSRYTYTYQGKSVTTTTITP